MKNKQTLTKFLTNTGFVFNTNNLYSGLSNSYDYGYYGTLLKNNLIQLWKNTFYYEPFTYLIDVNVLNSADLFVNSGHLKLFNDEYVSCLVCHSEYRIDYIDLTKPCLKCKALNYSKPYKKSLMYQTNNNTYLRPETAQSIFANFKNLVTTTKMKFPFSIAQIGKSYRDEQTNSDFLFRLKEFTQAEIEHFVLKENAENKFNEVINKTYNFLINQCEIKQEHLKLYPQTDDEKAHYSLKTTDILYEFYGEFKELAGICNRGDYDLKNHHLTYNNYELNVIEPSLGIDRLVYTILHEFYYEDKNGYITLKLPFALTLIKVAILPLIQKFNDQALGIYKLFLKNKIDCIYLNKDSIGARYKYCDSIGVYYCISIDDNGIKIRNRDDKTQFEMNLDEFITMIKAKMI